MASIELNKEAPDFEIDDFKEKTIKLSDYKGNKNVLIVFNRGFV